MFEMVALPPDQIIEAWKSADYLAAEVRLRLARCYRDQYERLDSEFANLRTSWFWSSGQADEKAAHLLLAYLDALSPYMRQRGLHAELLRWCEDGLRACERLRQNPGRLLLLRSEAQNALGRWIEAAASIRAAITVSREKDPDTYARAVLALGCLQMNQGNYRGALDTLHEAEKLLLERSDYEGVAVARSEVAAYYLNRRDLDKALSLYHSVDRLRKQAGAAESSDHTLLMLGVVHRKKGEYRQATLYLQQLLERSERELARGAIATAAHHLAWVYLNQGNLTQARSLCGRAIALYEDLGDIRGASDAYEQLGLIFYAEGKYKEALHHLKQSLEVRRRLDNRHGAASSLRHLAIVHLRTGHPLAGIRELWQSLTLYWRLGVLTHYRLAAILYEFLDWTIGRQRWTV